MPSRDEVLLWALEFVRLVHSLLATCDSQVLAEPGEHSVQGVVDPVRWVMSDEKEAFA